MAMCKGEKGGAMAAYSSRFATAIKNIKNLPHDIRKEFNDASKLFVVAFADGCVRRIAGCAGIERPTPKFVRILGKNQDGYRVMEDGDKEAYGISKEDLQAKLVEYYGDNEVAPKEAASKGAATVEDTEFDR